jgi:hypothetical protein
MVIKATGTNSSLGESEDIDEEVKQQRKRVSPLLVKMMGNEMPR